MSRRRVCTEYLHGLRRSTEDFQEHVFREFLHHYDRESSGMARSQFTTNAGDGEVGIVSQPLHNAYLALGDQSGTFRWHAVDSMFWVRRADDVPPPILVLYFEDLCIDHNGVFCDVAVSAQTSILVITTESDFSTSCNTVRYTSLRSCPTSQCSNESGKGGRSVISPCWLQNRDGDMAKCGRMDKGLRADEGEKLGSVACGMCRWRSTCFHQRRPQVVVERLKF